MAFKTNYAPMSNRQRPNDRSQKFDTSILQQPAIKFIRNGSLVIVTLLAVFSGLAGPQKDLEQMGIFLDPTHG